MSTRDEKLQEEAMSWGPESVFIAGANWQREQDAELMRVYEELFFEVDELESNFMNTGRFLVLQSILKDIYTARAKS